MMAMNSPENRTCPFCAEIIKTEAKLCPHCRQWLTLKSFRHPLIVFLFFIIPMAAILLGFITFLISAVDELQNPKPNYSEFPASLKLLESHMNWTGTSNGLRIYVTGVLTNTSPIPWRDGEFDCRFFDANGLMIDADTGYGRIDVCPHGESAFRVSIIPTARTNDYVSFKVLVGNARSAKGLPWR
jgi:hypothetical protein